MAGRLPCSPPRQLEAILCSSVIGFPCPRHASHMKDRPSLASAYRMFPLVFRSYFSPYPYSPRFYCPVQAFTTSVLDSYSLPLRSACLSPRPRPPSPPEQLLRRTFIGCPPTRSGAMGTGGKSRFVFGGEDGCDPVSAAQLSSSPEHAKVKSGSQTQRILLRGEVVH